MQLSLIEKARSKSIRHRNLENKIRELSHANSLSARNLRKIPDPAVKEYHKLKEYYPNDRPYDLIDYDIDDAYLKKLGDILQVAIEAIPDQAIRSQLRSIQWNQDFLRDKANGWCHTSIIDMIKVNVDPNRYPSVLAATVAHLTAEKSMSDSELQAKTTRLNSTEDHINSLWNEFMERARELQADLTRKDGQLAEKDVIIAHKSAAVSEKDAEVQMLQQKVSNLEQEARDCAKTIGELNRQFTANREQAAEQIIQLEAYRTTVAEIQAKILGMK